MVILKMANATLHTQRLHLVPFTDRHVGPRHLAWLSDKTLMQFSEQRHRSHTLESCAAYAHSFDGSPNYYWAIERQNDQSGHIGTINAYVDANNKTADIGLLIGSQDARGQGYGLEAWRGVIDFLFDTCNMRKITAGTMLTNTAMVGIMQQSSMMPDGLKKRQFLDAHGNEVDAVYMAIFKEEWTNAHE